ncbi:MAG: CoA transferase [Chitinophagaceae bacterium]|nr:CoA transferase [Chitinophagaceae bacterium]
MDTLPLYGIRVLEFTHAVMGPAAGLLLADAGAEVIHVEPPGGDETRRLKGFGTGYFTFYNRNKKSLAVDLKSPKGKEIIYRLTAETDIVVENFGPGTMDRLGFSYERLTEINPSLIYCSLKGFLKGPYEHRHAMDEVVQMMGGLAYMTGRPGDPLRAGTSIVDITGGMFGFIGILLALLERQQTGKGKFIKSGLFETTAFLMGQHMAYGAISQQPVPPMPARVSAWSIYRIFETKDGEQVFIGIISDKHWKRFCEEFGWTDFVHDERLNTNNKRIDERNWLLPELEKRLKIFSKTEILEKCEKAAIPFAPIAKTEDLFEDIHLNQNNSLLTTRLPDGRVSKLPALPIEYQNQRFFLRNHPPDIGEHTLEIIKKLNYTDDEVRQMLSEKIISVSEVETSF